MNHDHDRAKFIHRHVKMLVSIMLVAMSATGCDRETIGPTAATTRENSGDSGGSGAARRVNVVGDNIPANNARTSPRPPREQPEGHRKMVALLKEFLAREPDDNRLMSDRSARELRAKLADLPASMSEHEEWLLHYNAGLAELVQGNEQVAIDHYAIANELFPNVQATVSKDDSEDFIFHMAIAHLRYGETQNCCMRKSPDNCVMPIRGGGIHTRQEGSRRAIELFTRLLRNTARNEVMHLRAQWLLNIAYMTVGGYPDKVPTEFLISPTAFDSEESFPRFMNIAQKVGLDLFGLSGGVIADDFDNDGYLDLFISGWDLGAQLRYFHNNQDGTFTDHTTQAGLTGITGGLNMVQADYNNDGFVDVLVIRGAWLGKGGRLPLSLIRNNGDGTFTDVTFDAGLGNNFYPSQSAGWADYDNDGKLDLFVCGEFDGDWSNRDPATDKYAPCQLFHNNGDGTFTDRAAETGVINDRFAKGCSWGDYDGDGLPDLYVSNLGQPNRLYHNNGDGTFTDVAPELNVTRPIHSFSCWFWDFDNDGILDIFVSAYDAQIEDLAVSYLGLRANCELACLYRGDGHGGFNEVASGYNLLRPTAPMGANFGDLDNDGYLDFYLGTGAPPYYALMPNMMYHNQGGKKFLNVTTAGGFGNLQKGHGIAWADFDNDGDQDIFSQMGGALPGDKFYDSLYENPGFGNHWIGIKLVGVRSNRSAIGARIHVEIIENGEKRSIYKHVNSGASFGANPLRQTIGLGKADKIERLEIYWPTTGQTETFRDVPLDRYIQIVESEGRYTDMALKSFKLGGNTQKKAKGA